MTRPNDSRDPNATASAHGSTAASRVDDAARPYEPQIGIENERPRSTAAQWTTVGLLAVIGFGFLGWLLLSDNDDEAASPASESVQVSQPVDDPRAHAAHDGVVGLPAEGDAAETVGAEEAEEAEEAVSGEAADALQAAEEYLAAQPLSKSNLYNQLRDEEGFSADAASYAVDNVEADWKDLALQVAQQMKEDGTKDEDLLTALTEDPEHFTRAQAEFAIDNL